MLDLYSQKLEGDYLSLNLIAFNINKDELQNCDPFKNVKREREGPVSSHNI